MGLQEQLEKDKGKSSEEVDITQPKAEEPKKENAQVTKETKKVAGAKKELTQGEPLTVTPELVQELFATLRDQKALIEKLSAPKAQTKSVDTYAQSIVDDYMEEPAVFFAFSNYYAILGYFLRGSEVQAPRGIIRFTPLYRYKSKASGRQKGENEVISVCQTIIHSRRDYDFLVNSPFFKVKFFENMKDAANVDTFLAEKMSQASNFIAQLNDYQVLERARAEGISIENPDFKVLRQRLTDKTARKALEQEKQKRQVMAKKTIEHTDLDEKLKEAGSLVADPLD